MDCFDFMEGWRFMGDNDLQKAYFMDRNPLQGLQAKIYAN